MRRIAALLAPVLILTGLAIFQASPASAAYTTNAATLCVQANHGGDPALGTAAVCGWIKQIRDSNTGQVRGTVAVISVQDQGGNVDAVQVNRSANGVVNGPAFSGQVDEADVHVDTSGCTFCGATSVSSTCNCWANSVGVFDGDGGQIHAVGSVSIRWHDGQLSTVSAGSFDTGTYRCAGLPSPLIDCGSSTFSINP
jgi:hypothetical protein